ncbi:hypothetical protein E2562_007025 [Oryza meyeriana var. granulata]|uniref:Uncharacterized protein n=1 Tax=Oryza meyeriana var. granulata TaxID=110450 RepID=A0A6G1E0C6_9ORYZ|nr:hypothetical protein E2562_021658 [Oryza meyeriana var. granulata]KAF0921487.1 hypothetical protein E2562_007025 [Oryza meyeriana var. granulata]
MGPLGLAATGAGGLGPRRHEPGGGRRARARARGGRSGQGAPRRARGGRSGRWTRARGGRGGQGAASAGGERILQRPWRAAGKERPRRADLASCIGERRAWARSSRRIQLPDGCRLVLLLCFIFVKLQTTSTPRPQLHETTTWPLMVSTEQ